METVGNYPDLASARVAQSLLASEGIEAEIPDEYLSGLDWTINTAIHGLRLRVAPADAEAARQILQAGQVIEKEDDADPDVCPDCRSGRFGPAAWKKRMKAIAILFPPLLLLYPIVLLVSSERYECYECGRAWT